MAITQYKPTTDLFSPLLDDLLGASLRGGRMRDLLRVPEAEVLETDTEIRVAMDMPGMKPDEVEISLENNVLTVSGERRAQWTESDERSGTWHLAERRYGKFSRSFVLPRDVEPDGIQARAENGVLHVTVPKSERVRRRRIEVQGGGQGDGAVEVGNG